MTAHIFKTGQYSTQTLCYLDRMGRRGHKPRRLTRPTCDDSTICRECAIAAGVILSYGARNIARVRHGERPRPAPVGY